MRTHVLAFAFLILMPLLLLPAPSARADSSPPEVTERWWEPRYPIAPEKVALYARVSDPDGVQTVGAVWCYVPAYLCQYPPLYDDGTNGDVVAGDGLWTNGSVDTHRDVIGASYKLDAFDTQGNSLHLDSIYALFVDSLNLTLESDFVVAEPGQALPITGTALYEDNASAPAEGLTVHVSVPGSSVDASVQTDGTFAAVLAAPAEPGVYTILAEASDRSLGDSVEATLAATSTPTPDLLVRNLRTSVPDPVEGEVYLRFDARNDGTQATPDVRVLVELVRDGASLGTLLDTRVPIAAYGASVPLVAQRQLAAGTHTVRVSLDPDNAIDELDEANNIQELTFTVRARPESASPLVAGAVGAGAVAAVATAILVAVRWRRRRDVPSDMEKAKE